VKSDRVAKPQKAGGIKAKSTMEGSWPVGRLQMRTWHKKWKLRRNPEKIVPSLRAISSSRLNENKKRNRKPNKCKDY